ncbi:MAG: DUF839 domain-containing protein [Bacillaceae bacterium]|nr:DUF839 domain-containing protein [Bacillaceae bacterium]
MKNRDSLKKKLISTAVLGTLILSPLAGNTTEANHHLIPLRAALESEGADLSWDQDTQTVSFTLKNGLQGSVQIGSTEFELAGITAELSEPVILKNGQTRVPADMIEVLKTKDLTDFVLHQGGFKSRILLEAGAPLGDGSDAGQKFDLNAYVPIDGSREGWLFTSNETRPGGGFVQRISKDQDGFYQVLESRRIQFDEVGGTWNNCAGNVTPWGTVLSGEEWAPSADDKGFLQTVEKAKQEGIVFSDNHLNFGLIVEIDPATGEVKKHRSMGRFSHEAAIVMPDRKTAYLTDDYRGGIFAKFVADQAGDLSSGTLYAARYDRNNQKVEWIEIPDEQLDRARDYALEQGATGFGRPEDLELNPVDGNIYWAETEDPDKENKRGRVYQFNPNTDEMKPFVEGSADTFSNPDGIAIHPVTGDIYVHEDNYSSNMLPTPGQDNNALWKVSLEDRRVVKFASVPYGAEVTGGFFTPDGKVMFVNVQHPADPVKDQLVMIKGF